MNPKTPKTPENTTDKEQYTSIFDAPTAVSEKPVKKRRISKRALNTIVALVVCAALGAGAFAAVHFWGKDDTDDDSSSGAESEAELSYVFDLGDYSSSATDGDNLKMGPVTNVVIKTNTTPSPSFPPSARPPRSTATPATRSKRTPPFGK